MRFRSLAAVAAASLVVLTACGSESDDNSSSSPSGGSGGTFDVVFISGLSGPLQPVAGSMAASLKGAVADINDNGGIDGKQVKLETLDGQGDPAKSVSVLQDRLSSGPKPSLLYLGVGSPEALAMLPIAARAGIASVSAASTIDADDSQKYPLHRGSIPLAVNQLTPLPGYVSEGGYSKIDIVTTQDASGDAYVSGVKQALGDSGVTIKDIRVAPDELDTSGAWEKAKSDDPDMVFVNCLGDPCARIFDGRLKAGATDIPVVGGTSMSGTGAGPASYVSSPDALENVSMIVYSFQVKKEGEPDSDMFTRFLKGYTANTDKVGALIAPAGAWDGLYMFKYAADEAKSTDPQDMVDALTDGLGDSDPLVIYNPLTFDSGHLLPTPAEGTLVIIPADSAVGSDGRFVVAGS